MRFNKKGVLYGNVGHLIFAFEIRTLLSGSRRGFLMGEKLIGGEFQVHFRLTIA